MYKYKVREGSFIDWARYGLTGVAFGLLLGVMVIF